MYPDPRKNHNKILYDAFIKLYMLVTVSMTMNHFYGYRRNFIKKNLKNLQHHIFLFCMCRLSTCANALFVCEPFVAGF